MTPGGGWSLLRAALAARRAHLLRMAGWSAVEALPALAGGLLIATAIDQGFLAGRPWVGLAWLAGYGCCVGLRLFAGQRLFPHLAEVVEPVRDVMVQTVVAGTLRRATTGAGQPDTAAVTRLTSDVRSIRGLVAALLSEFRAVAVSTIAALVGLALLEPVLALVAILPIAVSLAAFTRLQRRLRARQQDVLVAEEAIAAVAVAGIDGIRDVAACRAQEEVARRIGEAIDAQAAASARLARSEASRLLVLSSAHDLPLLALLLAAPVLMRSAHLTPGQLVGVVTYLTTGLQPAVGGLLGSLSTYGLQLGVTLDRIHATSAPAAARHAGRQPDGYLIQVEELTFAYGAHGDPVVRGLSLRIEPGEHVAVVGRSGTGKSTLAGLLCGVLSQQQGSLRLGGVPVTEVAGIQRHVTLVPQQAYVFTGTLRENLTYLAPTATTADLDRTCAALGLAGWICGLGGYETLIGTADRDLSEADKQRIALARAHLTATPVVVLDEATCFLDPATEDLVEQAFRARAGTLIVIAHRMTSALRADRVLLLDGGRPVIGSHPEVLASSAGYRELVGHWDAARPAA